jgi:hypothetical protein
MVLCWVGCAAVYTADMFFVFSGMFTVYYAISYMKKVSGVKMDVYHPFERFINVPLYIIRRLVRIWPSLIIGMLLGFDFLLKCLAPLAMRGSLTLLLLLYVFYDGCMMGCSCVLVLVRVMVIWQWAFLAMVSNYYRQSMQ